MELVNPDLQSQAISELEKTVQALTYILFTLKHTRNEPEDVVAALLLAEKELERLRNVRLQLDGSLPCANPNPHSS